MARIPSPAPPMPMNSLPTNSIPWRVLLVSTGLVVFIAAMMGCARPNKGVEDAATTAAVEAPSQHVDSATGKDSGDMPPSGAGKAGRDAAAGGALEARPEGPNASSEAEVPPGGRDLPTASAGPWRKVVEDAGEQPGFEEIAFLPFEAAFDRPDRDDLRPWFARTEGAGFRVRQIQTQYGRSGTIEGVGRLLCPWPEDGVLRLQLDNFNRLKLHFFGPHPSPLPGGEGERRGVTLVYYEDQGHRWAAYATTREEGKPTPKTWAITATDDDRCRRTELRFGGPIELRYCAMSDKRDGELTLSRGDVVLLTAPLAGPPSDVFFEGRATVHGIALARTKDAPAAPAPRPLKATGVLEWQATKPEIAKPQVSADGSVRFAGDRLKQRAECFAPLPDAGLQEIVLELADVAPGAGVYLGRAGGKAEEVVRFIRDRRSGQLGARLRGADDQWEADVDSPSDRPAALVQSQCWVRLLYGCGNLRWWLSSDGVHWAQVEPAKDNVPPGVTSIGLQLVANCPNAGVTVKRVMVRRLEGLASLGGAGSGDPRPTGEASSGDPRPAESLGGAGSGDPRPATAEVGTAHPTLVTAKTLADWLVEAMKQKPAEMETSDWLRACSVRTLGGGAGRVLAYPLLEALLDDAAGRGLPLAQQLAALDDAMLLALDLRDGSAMRVGLLNRYPRLGVQAADESGLRAWSSVRAAYHAAPVVTRMLGPTDLDRVIRWELVNDVYRREPEQTLDFVRRLKFFQQHRERPLAAFVESALARGGRNSTALLEEELSKETYNALTELKAVLESEAWDDAARLVTSLGPETAPGIAPYVNDRSLLTSLPVAVQLALEDYPQLQRTLLDKFSALAKLRIAEAMHAGDAATIELATVQFAGTPAAAEAHRWLGDRALVGGFFERAIGEYEKASASVVRGQETRAQLGIERQTGMSAPLAARIRLAAAMLGRDAGDAATEPVEFGDVTMSAAEFESLIAEMKGRGAVGLGAIGEMVGRAHPTVAASGFAAHVRSRLDGPVGERPQEEVGRRTNQHRVPWADRQIATAVDQDTLYVSNRFQVAAYELASGKRIWQSQAPALQMQRAQEWAMIPMRPLVLGDRIIVRMLYSPNPILACLEKSTGKLLWIGEVRERALLVSDPLIVQGQLVALGMAVQPDQQGLLRMWTYDAQSGEIVRQRDLVQLRGAWGARGCCEVAVMDDGLVAVLGGVTAAVDAAGKVRWVRTQAALPADDDPRWVLQSYDRPLVHGERVYAAQPGVRTVECLAAATGRKIWSAVLPEVVGIVGLAGDVLVIRTEAGGRGLSLNDGSTRWRYAADDLFSFQLIDDERLLVARRERVPDQNERWQTRLVWLKPADGQALATTVLTDLADSDPRLGPLVPYKDRVFTFFGRGQHDPTRELVELVPRGAAEVMLPRGDAWHELLNSLTGR